MEPLAFTRFDFSTCEFLGVEEDAKHQKVHPPALGNTPFRSVSIQRCSSSRSVLRSHRLFERNTAKLLAALSPG